MNNRAKKKTTSALWLLWLVIVGAAALAQLRATTHELVTYLFVTNELARANYRSVAQQKAAVYFSPKLGAIIH